MTKKFDKLNETFNVSGEIVPAEVETIVEKVEKGKIDFSSTCILSLFKKIDKQYGYCQITLLQKCKWQSCLG